MVDQIFAIVMFSASLVTTMFYFNYNVIRSYNNRTLQKREITDPVYDYKETVDYLINTVGCYIPNYGKKLQFTKPRQSKSSCNRRAVFIRKIYKWRKPKLIFRIDKEKLMQHYFKKKEKYECCFSFALRSNETGFEDRRIRYTKCKKFKSGAITFQAHEVIVVKCYTKTSKQNKTSSTNLYEDAYAFVKKLPTSSMNERKERSWNVLLLGIDTMSRARIISTMPKVYKYLKTHGWLDYKGYQKVGYNTFPNVISVLTGKKRSTIDNECKLGMHECNHLMAWSTFSTKGYITAYGEDNIQLPDTFFHHGGFKTAPTNHYMRPFFLTGEQQRGNLICTKHQPSGLNVLDYAYDFANTYKKEKFFGTFWINSFSHNNDYMPSLFTNNTVNFLKKLSSAGTLNDTFVIFLSDHGIRTGLTRLQLESYYAERLPMLFIWVPTRFRKMYPFEYNNILLNRNRLVAPYDIYLTLIQISNLPRSSDDIASEGCPLCKDLFKEHLPNRTCSEASVDEKWCSCHNMSDANSFKNIDAVNTVQLVSSYLQNYTLHVETSNSTSCHPLRLNKVFRVHSYVNQKKKMHYVVAFQMVPDRDRLNEKDELSFEATVIKERKKLKIVDGSVTPISTYKHKTRCIKNRKDYGYCICRAVCKLCKVIGPK